MTTLPVSFAIASTVRFAFYVTIHSFLSLTPPSPSKFILRRNDNSGQFCNTNIDYSYMEQSNNSSNSATVGGEPNDIDSECERVLLETMKFHDMPYHASSAPVHSLSGFLERQPSYLEATRPTSQAAAASAAIPSVYYPHPYIGTGTDTGTDVGGGLLVHNHLGTEPTEGSEPASSLTFQNIPTSSTTSKDNIIQLPHSNDV